MNKRLRKDSTGIHKDNRRGSRKGDREGYRKGDREGNGKGEREGNGRGYRKGDREGNGIGYRKGYREGNGIGCGEGCGRGSGEGGGKVNRRGIRKGDPAPARPADRGTAGPLGQESVVLGSDHGGFSLKETIKQYLEDEGVPWADLGTRDSRSVDYPGYALKVAERVARGDFHRGILVCGTGIGMVIAANKVPGIRAALCGDCFSARACREHNDANVLALGERVTGPGLALEIVRTFLQARFSGERHRQRLDQVIKIEDKYCR